MRFLIRVLSAVLLFMVLPLVVSASSINGGRGLPHTKAAYTTRVNHLWAKAQTRFWGKKAEFTNEALGVQSGSTIWVVQGLTSLSYGLSKNAAVSLTPILYQDTHQESGNDIFWDTFLDLRFGGYKIQGAPIWMGFNIGSRFPTGSHHNVIFEEYTAGRFEWGLTGMMSYRYLSPDLKYDYRVHLNLGYWNYNDSGRYLSDDRQDPDAYVSANSQSFRYALGFEFPTMIFDYGLEVYGLSWIIDPPPAAYSRENFLYMNVSLGYKPHPRFHFYANGDFRLTPDKDKSEGESLAFASLPNYPDWRVTLGLKYLISPKSVYEMHQQSYRQQKKSNRRKLLSQLQEEREKTAKTQQELQTLQEEKKQRQQQLHQDNELAVDKNPNNPTN